MEDGNNLGIGAGTPAAKLDVNAGAENFVANFTSTDSIAEIRIADSSNYTRLLTVGTQFKIMPNDGSETLILDGNNDSATFAGSITAPSSLNFTANTAIIKVGSTWNTGKFQFLNGPTTAIEFDIPNNRIKNNLGSYLTASSSTGKFGSFDNQSMSLVTNNTARLTIDNSGDATFAGNIILGDGQYIHLGDNPDLKIYHNGSHSFIQNQRS